MDDMSDFMLYIAGPAILFGVGYALRNRRAVELGIRLRERLLRGSDEGGRLRRWLLPGGHTHDPGIREIPREDESHEDTAHPTPSTSAAPEIPRHTPMYKGQPARLWWLPEQEIPKAQGDAAPQTMAESVRCAKCGEMNPSGSAFCGGCGLYLRRRRVQLPQWRSR
jgi:hypothetical protein